MTRNLSWLLRHGANKEGLEVDAKGFVPVSQVLGHRKIRQEIRSLDQLRQVVKDDNKGRFELWQDPNGKGFFIRAVQGHSIDIVADEATSPITLEDAPNRIAVHGTYRKFLGSILAEGLCRMGRIHIHFAQGLPPSSNASESGPVVISGMRSSAQVAIYVDLVKAIADGVPFYLSANGVILTPGIGERGLLPPKYFKRVIDLKTGKTIATNLGSTPLDATSTTISVKPNQKETRTHDPSDRHKQQGAEPKGRAAQARVSDRKDMLPCAGVVVFDRALSVVLLVKTHTGAWGFPKGKRNSGETLEHCALRELKEETSLTPEAIEPIRSDFCVDERSSRGDRPAIRLYVSRLCARDSSKHPDKKSGKEALDKAKSKDRDALPRTTPEDVGELASCEFVALDAAIDLLESKRVDVLNQAIGMICGLNARQQSCVSKEGLADGTLVCFEGDVLVAAAASQTELTDKVLKHFGGIGRRPHQSLLIRRAGSLDQTEGVLSLSLSGLDCSSQSSCTECSM